VDNGRSSLRRPWNYGARGAASICTSSAKAKPKENGLLERFNRTYREDVLDADLFETLHQVRAEANRWKWEYNNERPHESLGNLTPRALLLKLGQLPNVHGQASGLPTLQQDNNTNNDSINFTKDNA
jgi:putative transposase